MVVANNGGLIWKQRKERPFAHLSIDRPANINMQSASCPAPALALATGRPAERKTKQRLIRARTTTLQSSGLHHLFINLLPHDVAYVSSRYICYSSGFDLIIFQSPDLNSKLISHRRYIGSCMALCTVNSVPSLYRVFISGHS